MHVGEDAEVDDAARAHILDQGADATEVLDPQRDGRVFKHALGIAPVLELGAAGVFPFGDILCGDQQLSERFLVAREHGPAQLDVEPATGQRVVHSGAGKFGLALPQVDQLMNVGLPHVVAEDLAEIAGKLFQVSGLEQFQRLAVDLKDADLGGAIRHAAAVFHEKGANVGHAFSAPDFELRLHRAEILDPHRDRCEFENVRVHNTGHWKSPPERNRVEPSAVGYRRRLFSID